MTDQAFNRTPIYPLEKPIADDINQGFSQADRALRDSLRSLFDKRSGLVNGSFQVVAQSPNTLGVVIKAGTGFQDAPTDVVSSIGGTVGIDDLSPYKPIVLTTDLNVAVPAAPGANSRIDLIEVRYDRKTNNQQSREFLDPATDAFAPALVPKTLDFNVDGTLAYYAATDIPTTALAYKSGVVAGSPVAPTTDTGYMPLAYITVGTGVLAITPANISDQRPVISTGGYLGRQVFEASGTYVPTPGTTKIVVRMVGAGGGGGGVANTAGNRAMGAGGASGVFLDFEVENGGKPIAGGAVVVFAGGPGVVGGNGLDGNNTSITINGTTYTAKGGRGADPGTPTAPTTTAQMAGVTWPYGGSTSGTGISQAAQAGRESLMIPTGAMLGGQGGSCPLGTGGQNGLIFGADSNGQDGAGYGAGGGGASAETAVSKAGGAGAPGVVLIDEFA
jgi:hypothetical protein